MELAQFRESLTSPTPPSEMSSLLRALWHDAKGDWKRAHEIVQDEEGANAARVHAYLHRKEGDLANAGYWYRRAKAAVCSASLDEEWERIAASLLAAEPRA